MLGQGSWYNVRSPLVPPQSRATWWGVFLGAGGSSEGPLGHQVGGTRPSGLFNYIRWKVNTLSEVVRAPIIHVESAVADTDETYGANVAAQNNAFNNTNQSNTLSTSIFFACKLILGGLNEASDLLGLCFLSKPFQSCA